MKVIPRKLAALCPLLLLLLLTPKAHANMAAPANPDVGTAITFENNQELAVTSEVLDITVKGAKAEIVATYTMENTTDQQVVTSSMFLSPNVEAGNVTVLVDGQEVPVVVESYTLGDVTQIDTQNWQYVVLDGEAADVGGNRPWTPSFLPWSLNPASSMTLWSPTPTDWEDIQTMTTMSSGAPWSITCGLRPCGRIFPT